jgi:hypothetical protein
MILMEITVNRMTAWMTEKTNLGKDANPVLNYSD